MLISQRVIKHTKINRLKINKRNKLLLCKYIFIIQILFYKIFITSNDKIIEAQYIIYIYMTRPFQYDNFVQSQIAMGNSYENVSFPSNPQSRNNLQTSYGNQNRNSLKQKINQLLGLSKDQNNGIKKQFKQVMAAEREILDMMKDQYNEPPRFNNYTRSNVQMFPGPAQVAPTPYPQYNQGYEEDQKMQSYQGFQPQKGANHYSQQQYPQNNNYQNNNLQQYENYQYQPQNFQPAYHQPHQQQGGQQRGYYQPYGNYYNATAPPQQVGPASIPNDRANILKSKIMQLKQQNNRLKNLASQTNIPRQQDDFQIQQLQNQVMRLKNIILNYQNQLSNLGNTPKSGNQKLLLKKLLEQGQRIRQDTIALLSNRNIPTSTNNGYTTYVDHRNPAHGNFVPDYRSNAGYRTSNQYSNGYPTGGNNISVRQGGQNLNRDQINLLRAQLNNLRNQCAQLHQQNASIKRISKGTNYTTTRY